MHTSDKIMVIPVGMSPIHSFRILRSIINHNFDVIFLTVSKETLAAGQRIIRLMKDCSIEINLLYYSEISNHIQQYSEVEGWSLMFGPGTREMVITLWYGIISGIGKSPTLWADHRKKTQDGKGRTISGEYAFNLSNSNERVLLEQVNLDDALAIYNLSKEEYHKFEGLSWDAIESKFLYQIEVPLNARDMNKKEARAWEESVVVDVNLLRKRIGKHALNVKRTPVPSTPLYWSNVGERLTDYGIRGGTN